MNCTPSDCFGGDPKVLAEGYKHLEDLASDDGVVSSRARFPRTGYGTPLLGEQFDVSYPKPTSRGYHSAQPLSESWERTWFMVGLP